MALFNNQNRILNEKTSQEKLDSTWLSSSLFILLICIVFRFNTESPLQITTYISAFFLASNLILLPTFLESSFTNNLKWYQSYAFILSCILLSLTVIGWFSNYLNISFISKVLIWISGFGLLVWYNIYHIRNTDLFFLIGGVTFFGFLTLANIATTGSTPIYLESIVTGLAHRDMMYHASVIEIIAQNGIPSTGVHGTPFINYHWGSHYLFAGLQGLIGVRALPFLNIVYPAVFFPLLFKLLFTVFRKLSLFRKVKLNNPLFFLAFISVLYSIGFLKISSVGSISLNISFMLMFILILSITEYKDEHSSGKSRHFFYLYCTLLLVFISISKISTGFLTVIASGYLIFRLDNLKSKYLWIIGSGLFIATIVYLYVLPVERFAEFETSNSFLVLLYSSIFSWLTLVFSNTFGFLSHLIGLLLVITYLLKKYQIKKFSDLKTLYKSKENIDLETISLVSLCAIFVTFFLSSKSDVNYFTLIPLQLGIIYAGIYLMAEFETFKSNRNLLKVYLLVIIFLSVISRPDISESHYYSELIKEQYQQSNNKQEVFKEFIKELNSLRYTFQGEKIAIYLPPSEDWYYNSQTYRPISSAFIVPALTGIPMISGIPQFILDSDRKTYGFAYYDTYTDLPFVSLEQTKNYAKQINFQKLIVYQIEKNSLEKKIYDL